MKSKATNRALAFLLAGTLGLNSKRKYNPNWSSGHSTVAEVGDP